MLEGLLHLFSPRPAAVIARDILDVMIVAWVLYRALLVLRGTRAQQVALGLLVVGAAHVLARLGGLVTLGNLLDLVVSSLVILLVVVFQNDIRRALMRVGDKAWLPGLGQAREAASVDEVVAAATELARHRTGALIAFEQNANLDEFVVNQGIQLDAAITRELLASIFIPESANKLHDGAVILRSLRVASAGVFFPMPESRSLDASLGSRHRAALGVSEETDAIVIVVSEERGSITVCYRGNMIPNLDGQRLKGVLYDLMGFKMPKVSKKEQKEAKELPLVKAPPAPPPRAPMASLPPTSSPPASLPPTSLPMPSATPTPIPAASGVMPTTSTAMPPAAMPATSTAMPSASTTPRVGLREVPKASMPEEGP